METKKFEVIGDGDQKTGPEIMFRNDRVLYHYALILEPTSGTRFRIYENMGKYNENFLENYYSVITDKCLQKYNVSTSFYLMLSSMPEKIPDNFGRIPTLDELSEKMDKYDEGTITKNDFNYEDKNSELSFLKELSYDLAKCLLQEFKIGKNAKLKFRFEGRKNVIDESEYFINVQDYTMVITDGEKNALCSLDLSKIE